MVEVPERMRSLPRDKRGYPIPVIVKRDRQGQPVFAVNDSNVQQRCVFQKLCPICGSRLAKDLWFTGGPKSAFHPHGFYLDSAMHHECMTFALQTCPYLAMPRYRATAEEARLAHLGRRLPETILVEHSMDPERPEVLVAIMTHGQSVKGNRGDIETRIAPARPYHGVEFWRHGQQLSFDEGLAVVKSYRGLDIEASLRLIMQRQPPSVRCAQQ